MERMIALTVYTKSYGLFLLLRDVNPAFDKRRQNESNFLAT